MFLDITHLRIAVDSVPDAEAYYASLFDLALVCRDILVDGEWFGLSPATDWRAADGAECRVSVLARGPLVLVLDEAMPAGTGHPAVLGLRTHLAGLNQLRIRAAEHGVDFVENTADTVSFDDRLGFRWHFGLAAFNDPASMGAGARTGRWWPA